METANLNQSGIYAITSPSGKRYVGQAKNIGRRWSRHRRMLAEGIHHCAGLQASHKKYCGALEFRILEICPLDRDLLNKREQYHMDTSPRGIYNSRPVADSNRGYRQSEESNQKRRLYRHSPETRKRMSLARKGRKLTDAHKSALTGIKRTAEMKEKRRGVKSALNTSGYVGVSKGRPGRWTAQVKFLGKTVHLASHTSAELAHQARQNFDRVLRFYDSSWTEL